MGEDPGGPEGSRRTQFRRYVAGVDQRDPQQVDRLADVLGALIEEVAASKVDFLVKAAESDGVFFADGVFRPAGTAASSFAVKDLAFLDERAKRLALLAIDSPKDAIGGAKELVESVCGTVLRLLNEPAPGKTADLADIAALTLVALELVSAHTDDAKTGADPVGRSLQHLGAVVASLVELRNVYGTGHRKDGRWNGLSPRHARLAVGAAITFAGFVAETYVESAGDKTDGSQKP